MATHSSPLALRIPWTEELGAGYCPWGRKESGTTERLHFHFLGGDGFKSNKVKVKVKLLSRARLFATPWIVACTELLSPWDFPGKTAGVDCHFLLQEIVPTQGLSPGRHRRQML